MGPDPTHELDLNPTLNPTLRERFSQALRPDVLRTVRARRVMAGALVALAAASALRPDPAGTYTDVAVAAVDLRPGVTLSTADVRLQRHSEASLPDGAITDPGGLTGATVAGPVRRGEILTDARVLGSRLAGLAVGPDARVVPVHLNDSAVLEVIHSGDIVDVLGAGEGEAHPQPRVLAVGAVVVLVSPAPTRPGAGTDRVVLIALPRAAAVAVAGAGLVAPVTLTLH